MDEREGAKLCAFCRTPCAESEEEYVKRNKLLMEKVMPLHIISLRDIMPMEEWVCHMIGQRLMNYI